MSAQRSSHRLFIAGVLVVSFVISGFSAAPARADDDVGKFLAGLVALGIIGAVINDAKDDKHDRHYDHGFRAEPKREVHKHYYKTAPKPVYRPKPQAVRRYDLPGGCLTSIKVKGDYKRFLAGRCLERNYKHTRALPDQCRVTIDNGHQRRHGFKPRCLRRYGYRLTAG